MVRRRYSNTAADTLLSGGISDVATSMTVDDTSGYPAVPFAIVIEPGTANEEVVLVTGRSGNNFTVITRAYDGTSASAHADLSVVKHVAIADDFRGVWDHVHDGNDANAISHDTLSGVSTDDHHSEVHAHDGVDGSGTVSHEDLINIGGGEDDHPEYILADGTRAFTGEVGGVDPTVDASLATKQYVDSVSSSGGIPVGAMIPWPYSAGTVPSGFLFCNGAAVLRSTYADLHALASADGYPHGSGDGVTTFNIPDMRGRFYFGKADAGTGSTLGGTFGAIDHIHVETQHQHGPGNLSTNSDSHSHSVTGTSGSPGSTSGVPSGTGQTVAHPAHLHGPGNYATDNDSHSHNVSSGLTALNTVSNTGAANPPGLAGNWMIKT